MRSPTMIASPAGANSDIWPTTTQGWNCALDAVGSEVDWTMVDKKANSIPLSCRVPVTFGDLSNYARFNSRHFLDKFFRSTDNLDCSIDRSLPTPLGGSLFSIDDTIAASASVMIR